MGFWADTWDSLVEQATLGPPGGPGRSTSAERDAYEAGASQVASNVGNFVELARVATAWTAPYGLDAEGRTAWEEGARALPEEIKSTAFDVWTIAKYLSKPWVLASLAGVAVLVVAAPYVTPFLRKP